MARMCVLKRRAWVREQASLQERHTDNDSFKKPDDFKKLDDEINKKAIILDELSDFISEQKPSFERLQNFVENEIDNAFRLTGEQRLMLQTLACAKLLCDLPSLENWRSIADIRYHSWEIENWLEPALSYYTNQYGKSEKIIRLGQTILTALISGELQPKSERYKNIAQKEAEIWSRETNPLKEIWFGLRGSRDELMPYLEFSPVFSIWFQKDAENFMTSMMSLNPYMAKSILIASGAAFLSATFANWQLAMKLVPCSFEKDGKYKKEYKSYLLIILLDVAYQGVLEAKHRTNNEAYVTGLIDDVVEVLLDREDYPAIVLRWGNWLERLVLQDSGNHDEFDSHGFIANKLLYVLGKHLNVESFIKKPAEDFESWEHWAHYSAMASHLYNKFLPECSFEDFAADWQLDVYSWGNEKAQCLINKSYDYTYLRGNLPGKQAYQFAYPFTHAEAPEEEWLKLWKGVHPLREIVAFGFKSDVYGYSYKERHEASGLLILLFLTGLALLDLLVTVPGAKKLNSIKKLFECLHANLITMLYIDGTINKEKWQSLYRHLAIRRVIWMGETESIFNEDDYPTISNFIGFYSNDAYELAMLLENILVNVKAPDEVLNQLQACGISAEELIEKVNILNKTDERRYPLNIKMFSQFITDFHNDI